MQLNLKLSIEVFAILASYLILTLPVAGATEVSIYYNNAPSGSPIELDYSDMVGRSVTVNNPGASASVSLSATNATVDGMIMEAHVYKCKGSSPSVCLSQASPVTYGSEFLAEYAWAEVRDTGTGYPQVAKIMSFVKVKRNGGVSWLGYWDVVTRTSETSFSVDSRDMDEIEVHADAAQFLGPIRHFIENFFMLPMNPEWVSKIVFRTATELNVLESSEMPEIEAEIVSGDEITSIDELYGFVFPEGSVVLGSSGLNLNPDYTCGAYGCETELSEGQSNCCYDCGCPTGFYCDAEMVCKSSSVITMSLHGTPDTRVINCNEDHTIYIPVKVNNLPSDAIVKSATQDLGGDTRQMTCTKGSGIFSCAVTVPAVAECDTGEYWVGPNSLMLVIEYSDGAIKATKSMSVSFPDITIGSFECGNEVCESSLGESQESCCLDCGCPAGDYCDWGGFGSVPSDAKCKDPLVNSDLYLGSISPSHFSDQPLTGNTPDIVVSIKNSPSNLHLDSLSCEMECSGSEGICASTCTLQSCVTDESVPGIYSRNCELNFMISNYDPLVDYELSPVFTAEVRYSNGTGGVMEATLTNTFPIISIGAHWCGDMICGSDENSYKCCYDCGCPDGQYCDTKSRTGPSSGDGCKDKVFVLGVESLGDTLLQDSSVQHYIDIPGTVSDYPSGTEIYGDCELQDGEFECSVICGREDSALDSEFNFTCQMIVPPIDYIGSPYYDPATREITLTGNSFSIRHVYNEGPDNMTEEYNFTAGEIRLNVTSHCGEGGCETNLDESQENCCRDCGCSEYGNDYFCYTGKNPNGVCLPNSSIILEIIGYEPDPVDCIIYKEGEECIVTINTLVDAEVVNPPAGIDIVASYYSSSSQENDTSISCFETLNDNVYTCPIALENIPDGASEGTENISLTLKMTIEYVMNDAIVWQDIQDTTSITVHKNYSTSVMSCRQMIQSIDDQISKLEGSKSSTNTWMIVFLVLAAIFLIIFIITCLMECGCQTIWLTLAITCLTSALSMMNSASSQDDQIAALEAQKQQKIAMCDAQTTAELAMAEGGLTEIPPIQT